MALTIHSAAYFQMLDGSWHVISDAIWENGTFNKNLPVSWNNTSYTVQPLSGQSLLLQRELSAFSTYTDANSPFNLWPHLKSYDPLTRGGTPTKDLKSRGSAGFLSLWTFAENHTNPRVRRLIYNALNPLRVAHEEGAVLFLEWAFSNEP